MSKYYAVRSGYVPGIYTTWKECQDNTKGYSGAVFKSFTNKADAEAYLNILPTSNIDDEDKVFIIYTDGSHKKSTEYLGLGAWSRFQGKEYSLSLNIDEALLKTYNINCKVSNPTAELLAVSEVLKRIPSSFYLPILIRTDYSGVKNWIEGTWQVKEEYIKLVLDSVKKEIRRVGTVYIEKVAGHSNDEGNDNADRLAKCEKNHDTFLFN